MAENDSTEERTEEPTAKRLEKARSEGRVARSQELSVAAMLIGTSIFLYFMGGYFVENLADERRKFERDLQQARRKLAATSGESTVTESRDVGGVSFVGRLLEGMPIKDLKGLADDMKSQLGSGVVAVISNTGGKASLVVSVSDDLTKRFNAVNLVQTGAIAVGGKGGGGRPDMAQAGGPNGASCQMALDAIAQAIEKSA